MSKGSERRPRQITRQEEQLRWQLATKRITFAQFERKYKQLYKQGLIRRSGRRI